VENKSVERQLVTKAMSSRHSHVGIRELVACSLKGWDEVWNRNNFFAEALLRRNPKLRMLFVEPPVDVLYDLWSGRKPSHPRLRTVTPDGRLRVLRPLKPLPRRIGSFADRFLHAQVLLAARTAGFSRPTLWINDVTYAPLIARTGWPSLYDVSDDWLLAPFLPREIERLRRLDKLALEQADQVVVCSDALAESRGSRRPVSLIPNAVDLEHFRRPRDRPLDLPRRPVAVYVGTLHDARIDIGLVADLSHAVQDLKIVLVGPNALATRSTRILDALANVSILGSRPYRDVPGYLQHADVVIIPHRVSPFMNSLDPIKAYECLAVDTPTVATPVAGFREYVGAFHVAERHDFVATVSRVLTQMTPALRRIEPASWEDRAAEFESALLRLAVDSEPEFD
jgi:teichuronic acid biosynthesis glycosyltransferase TuaH